MPPRKTPLDPRKSPSQSRARVTVEAILEGAAHILERDGIAGYNTNAVAERAGVSIGSLYQYFPNKDALTAALVDRETQLLIDDIGVAAGHTDTATRVRAMVRAAIAHQTRRPTLARALDLEERRLPLHERDQRVIDAVGRALPDDGSAGVTVEDLLAIIRAVVDAAGQRGDTDPEALETRVMRAVNGYLGQ
ncbi:TetR/AcrR family transcriptional regulator [Luteibacter sp. dw_328]|uniref:TetR/AcrR family transcriptional regulator n=1 Tax=Luteibacter sp. dw_328 TaxID=2719796 RepID=UPI001BD665C4|nr:TetR/AcrR family transcriptional regulator [Luteibacter sp. dw_328]